MVEYLTKGYEMARVHKAKRVVGGEVVETKIKSMCSANIIEVEVGANGFRGGKYSYGSRTFFQIRDESQTVMWCEVVNLDFDFDVDIMDSPGAKSVSIPFAGDTELLTFIDALKFAVSVLEKQAGEKNIQKFRYGKL